MFLVGGSQPSGDVSCFRLPEARSYASYAPAQPGTEIAGPPTPCCWDVMSLLFSKIPGARNPKRYLQNLDLDIDCIDVSWYLKFVWQSWVKGLFYSFPLTGNRDQVPYPGGRYARVLAFSVHCQLGAVRLSRLTSALRSLHGWGPTRLERDRPSLSRLGGPILIQGWSWWNRWAMRRCRCNPVFQPLDIEFWMETGRFPLQGGSMATRSHFTAVWRRPRPQFCWWVGRVLTLSQKKLPEVRHVWNV